MIIETNYNEDRITTTTQNIHVKDTSIIIVDSNMNSWLKSKIALVELVVTQNLIFSENNSD